MPTHVSGVTFPLRLPHPEPPGGHRGHPGRLMRELSQLAL
jgi:hypothetical protein